MGRLQLGVALIVAALSPACAATDTEPTPAPSQLFVTDYGGDEILRYDGATGAFTDVFAAGIGQRVDRPASVRLGPTGHLYSAGFGRGDVVRYDIDSGAMMDVFYWDTRLLEEPVELQFHGDELVVLGNDTKNIVVIDRHGTAVRSFGYPVMRAPHDFVIAGSEVFVATDTHPELGTAIQVWDLMTGQLVRHFGARHELGVATGLALDADGILYACDEHAGRVLRFDAATGASLGALVAPGVVVQPVSLDLGLDGALYVLDASGIHRFERATGELLSTLVAIDNTRLQRPRSFTFVKR